jgi:hypothetical protein
VEQKVPVSLAKKLSASELKRLESDLRNSVLAKELRRVIREHLESSYIREETGDIEDYSLSVGERRGLRTILNLLPEKTK